MNTTSYGLDIAKTVFQLYWVGSSTGSWPMACSWRAHQCALPHAAARSLMPRKFRGKGL